MIPVVKGMFWLPLIGVISAANMTWYVVPDGMNKTNCPPHNQGDKDCKSLAEYITNKDSYFKNNNTLMFLPGTHHLSTTLDISGIENLSFIGSDDSSKLVIIECNKTKPSGFKFSNSTEISITNINIHSCGAHDLVSTMNNNESKTNYSLQYERCLRLRVNKMKVFSVLFFENVCHINLTKVSVKNSIGYGISVYSCHGNITIQSSSFNNNTGSDQYIGGNARFVISNSCTKTNNNYLSIENSNFTDGKSYQLYEKHRDVPASGIHLCSFCPTLFVHINSSILTGNRGGNAYFCMIDFVSQNWTIFLQNSLISNGTSYRGAGIQFTTALYFDDYDNCSKVTGRLWNRLIIHHTNFTGNVAKNSGGAVNIKLTDSDCKPKHIELADCHFAKNSIWSFKGKGAAIFIVISKLNMIPLDLVKMIRIKLSNHKAKGRHSQSYTIVEIVNSEMLELTSSTFQDNSGTALSIRSSHIKFTGKVTFKNNTASNGGAMKLCGSSTFSIDDKTTILFENNHATVTGGAIYSEQTCIGEYLPCFFQPNVKEGTYIDNLETENKMKLVFVNNTAGLAGDAIYGGDIDKCSTYKMFRVGNKTGFDFSKKIVDSIFHFSPNSTSLISSDAYKVIFCNTIKRNINLSVVPGKLFGIKVRSVGQRNGASLGVITAKLDGTCIYKNTNLTQVDYYRPTQHCNLLNLSLTTDLIGSNNITISLIVQQNHQVSQYKKYMDGFVHVHVMSCPWGFQLENNTHSCVCAGILDSKVQCYLNELIIDKTEVPMMWIGCEHRSNNGTCNNEILIFSKECGRPEYCNLQSVNVTADTVDKQCVVGRTGIVCGSCKSNYSVVLGTSMCKVCSNSYLWLVVVYLSVGVLLIVLLTFLDITVTNGTLNGLLFYANLVHANKESFFTKSNSGYIFRVLIAWLNLDLGIEVCFFDGMDAYHTIWLEFGYIVYIWSLQATIIYLCRKYVFFTRWCGKNVTKVMATLIFMCSSKSFRAIVDTFLFCNITIMQETLILHRMIWSLESTIKYFSKKHILLVLIAILFFILQFMFVSSLLFIQLLRKISSMKVVNRLLPFFEAFTGPCNNSHAFWPGLLMWVQGLALFTFAVNAPSILVTGFSSFVVIVLSFLSPHGVYKKWSLNLLEFSFMMNLLITSTIIYILNGHVPHIIHMIVHTSIVIALGSFILYHCHHQVKKVAFKLYRVIVNIFHKRNHRAEGSLRNIVSHSEVSVNTPEPANENSALLHQMPPARVQYDVLREPLVEN